MLRSRIALPAVWSLVVSTALVLSASAAQAQPGPADRRERALEAFRAGEEAAGEERWADAITAFTEAYELTGVPTALYNVAYALRALGRYTEARDSFDELLSLTLSPEDRTDAETLRAEVVARIAHVEIQGLEQNVEYELRLDGQIVEDGMARPAVIDVDPGEHRVEVRRTGYVAFEWSGTLGEGQRRALEAELTPLPTSGGSIAEEPAFWIIIGVVVVGGAVLGGVLGDDLAQLRPDPDRILVRL